MEKIHFPLIPPRDLLRYVNFVEFMRVECNFLLLEASNYHMLPHSQPILQSIRTQVGGSTFYISSVHNDGEISGLLIGLVFFEFLMRIIDQYKVQQWVYKSQHFQVRSNDIRMVVIGGVDPHDRVSNQLFAINGDMSKSDFLPPMHEGLCR